MRFSEYYKLDKVQAELDFVDINVEQDTPLYLDPYAITNKEDGWSDKCSDLINSFFNEIIVAVNSKNKKKGVDLLSYLSEPEETCLGVSKGGNKGRGIGSEQAGQLYSAFANSRAAQSGIIEDLSDFALFIPNIGRDKISDITTNILRGQLIDYTQQQCNLYDIKIQQVASGFFWDPHALQWSQSYVDLPVINGQKILLVPKYAVRYQVGVDYSTYYNYFVLDYLRSEHLRAQDSLVHALKNGKFRVYQKDLQARYPKDKDFLAKFTEAHPDIIKKYKDELKTKSSRVPNIDDENFKEDEFSGYLIEKLKSIPPGNSDANKYHNLCIGIISFLFFPYLINPIKEKEINEGRKRIDILYTNSVNGGVFRRAALNPSFNAFLIPVECKNYSKDPVNPEFDQLIGRFNREGGKLGLLLYRESVDRGLIIKRCKDAVKAGQGCILPIDDEFLVTLLEKVKDGRRMSVDNFLDELYVEVIS